MQFLMMMTFDGKIHYIRSNTMIKKAFVLILLSLIISNCGPSVKLIDLEDQENIEITKKVYDGYPNCVSINVDSDIIYKSFKELFSQGSNLKYVYKSYAGLKPHFNALSISDYKLRKLSYLLEKYIKNLKPGEMLFFKVKKDNTFFMGDIFGILLTDIGHTSDPLLQITLYWEYDVNIHTRWMGKAYSVGRFYSDGSLYQFGCDSSTPFSSFKKK